MIMKNIKLFLKWILYVNLYIFLTTSVMAEQNNTPLPFTNDDKSIYYFNHIAINNMALNYGRDHQIIVQAMTLKNNPFENQAKILPKIPELGKVLWTITGNQLPISESDCFEFEAQHCNEYEKGAKNFWGVCSSLCLLGGVRFVAFHEETGIIYLGSQIGTGWSKSWPAIIYSANIKTKEIKKLILDSGPFDATLSPSGDYLILAGDHILIVNTNTGENFSPSRKSHIKSKDFVYVGYRNIRWLNNDTFQYETIEYTDKFSDKTDLIYEYTFDIRTRITKELGRKIPLAKTIE
jgi:hypothetical protein